MWGVVVALKRCLRRVTLLLTWNGLFDELSRAPGVIMMPMVCPYMYLLSPHLFVYHANAARVLISYQPGICSGRLLKRDKRCHAVTIHDCIEICPRLEYVWRCGPHAHAFRPSCVRHVGVLSALPSYVAAGRLGALHKCACCAEICLDTALMETSWLSLHTSSSAARLPTPAFPPRRHASNTVYSSH